MNVTCKAYRCLVPGSCPNPARVNTTVPLKDAEWKCCQMPPPCLAPTPYCEAQKQCKTLQQFCAPLLEKHVNQSRKAINAVVEVVTKPFLPFIERHTKLEHRRLLEEPTNTTTKSNVSEPLAVPETFGSAWKSQHDKLVAQMEKAASAAREFHEKQKEAKEAAVEAYSQELQAKLANWRTPLEQESRYWYSVLIGCLPVSATTCPYYLESTFLLHRGPGKVGLPVNTVAVLADTLHAVSCGDDAKCWVWRLSDGEPQEVFVGHSGPVYTVVQLSNNDLIFSGGAAMPLGDRLGATGLEARVVDSLLPRGRESILGVGWVWRWRNGSPRNKFISPKGSFLASTNIPGKQEVAVGAGRNGPFILNWATNGLGNILLPSGRTNSVAYVPSKVRFVSGHQDGTIRYWNAYTGELLTVIKAHQGPVNAVAASPVYQEAWSAGEDGTIKLWDLQSSEPVKFFTQAYAGPILSLGVVPGGEVIITGDTHGVVRFWQRHTGIFSCQMQTGGGAVRGLAINPSNAMGSLITANEDGYVRNFHPR